MTVNARFPLSLTLLLVGCIRVLGPHCTANDPFYFAEPPSIAVKGGAYTLNWRYGKSLAYFKPTYGMWNGDLVFTVSWLMSTGDVRSELGSIPISGNKPIKAIEQGRAFWWEPGGNFALLAIQRLPD